MNAARTLKVFLSTAFFIVIVIVWVHITRQNPKNGFIVFLAAITGLFVYLRFKWPKGKPFRPWSAANPSWPKVLIQGDKLAICVNGNMEDCNHIPLKDIREARPLTADEVGVLQWYSVGAQRGLFVGKPNIRLSDGRVFNPDISALASNQFSLFTFALGNLPRYFCMVSPYADSSGNAANSSQLLLRGKLGAGEFIYTFTMQEGSASIKAVAAAITKNK